MTRRFLWPSFALPGAVWLVLLFLVPTYAVLAVAFGTVDPIFSNPVPVWNPLHWQFDTMRDVLRQLRPGQPFWTVFVRTFAYVAFSLAGCLAIGYPVAYYLSRHAKRTKKLLLVLLIVPFWVSYLMRMLAWVGLLLPDGLVNRTLMDLGVLSHPYGWLDGQASSVILALIYGYVPYLILPLYATLDRIERSVLEAGRDLGASPLHTFLHVTLPLSKHGIMAASVLIALPMFGDYYTNDVISGLAAHDDDRQPDQPLLPGRPAADRRRLARGRALGAPRRADVVLPLGDGSRVAGAGMKRFRDWWANPWGQPRTLAAVTWLYMVWSIVPVCIASSSRSTTAGRAACGRASRRAGTGVTPTSRCCTTPRCAERSSRASGLRASTC